MKKLISFAFFICLLIIFATPTSASNGQYIIINKSTNQLAYYENNKLTRVFSVATGKSANLTPEGKFKIVNKIVNRPYYTGKIPGGDPRNPLGNRWLGLDAKGTKGTTYAIHGNNNPSSIGSYASLGCIRMHNDEVKWLFDKVKVNTTVIVTSSKSSFDTIAKANGYNIKPSNTVPVNSNISTVLKRGSRGEPVKELQRQLTKLGYNTRGVDGIFGPATETAVRKFQKDRKLTVDGVVGPQTRRVLEKK